MSATAIVKNEESAKGDKPPPNQEDEDVKEEEGEHEVEDFESDVKLITIKECESVFDQYDSLCFYVEQNPNLEYLRRVSRFYRWVVDDSEKLHVYRFPSEIRPTCGKNLSTGNLWDDLEVRQRPPHHGKAYNFHVPMLLDLRFNSGPDSDRVELFYGYMEAFQQANIIYCEFVPPWVNPFDIDPGGWPVGDVEVKKKYDYLNAWY